jgi:hypothetical protein
MGGDGRQRGRGTEQEDLEDAEHPADAPVENGKVSNVAMLTHLGRAKLATPFAPISKEHRGLSVIVDRLSRYFRCAKCLQCGAWPMALGPNEGPPRSVRRSDAPTATRRSSIRLAWPIGPFRLQQGALLIRRQARPLVIGKGALVCTSALKSLAEEPGT